MLDIAKILSGQFNLNMTKYAIESVVEMCALLRCRWRRIMKLVLRTEVDESLPVCLGDEQRLTSGWPHARYSRTEQSGLPRMPARHYSVTFA